MTTKINFNGVISENLSISFYDHGFLFGDSVYEVVATHKTRPCFLYPHLQRLQNSAEGISLSIPWSTQRFAEELQRTLLEAGNPESYIRIIVTRGEGAVDIDPSSCAKPNVIVYVTAEKKYPAELYLSGVNLAVVSVKRNARDALNPGIKTGNYLNNILAVVEANRLGAHDAVMLNGKGDLAESTTSNLFFAHNGTLFTPALGCGILAGITRSMVMQLAQENGISVEEGSLPVEALTSADEVFITGTIKRIMPVTRIDNKLVGEGRPGPLTQKMMRLYADVLESELPYDPDFKFQF